MKKNLPPVEIMPDLRKRAEDVQRTRRQKLTVPDTEAAIQKLINELEIQQIELELQNEELRHTKLALENLFLQNTTISQVADSARQETDEKYRFMFANHPQPMWITDTETLKFLEVNQAAIDHYGYTREEFSAMTLRDIRPPEDLAALMEDVEAARKQKRDNTIVKEWKHLKKNGELIHVEIIANPIEFNHRSAHHILINDITERKRNENEIKDKSTLLTNLIINMREGILLEDSDRRIYLTNQLFCDMFGIPVPPEMMVGADCSNSAEESKNYFTNPDKFISDINRILAEKKTVINDELELVDGRVFERDYIPNFINNQYIGHLWKYRDITERKATERMIRELNTGLEQKIFRRTAQLARTNQDLLNEIGSRKLLEAALASEKIRLASIIEGANVGTWEWNIQTGQTVFNERWADITGYTLAEISPSNISTWRGMVHPDDLPHCIELMEKQVRGESDYYSFESRIRHKNGDWKWVLNGGKVYKWDAKGKPLLMSGIHMDITESKMAADELQESRETHRGLSEAAFDSIFFSERGICIEQNSMAEKIFGYTKEEALGRYGTEWIVPEDRALVMDHMLSGYELPYEVTALRKDGTTFPAMLFGKMMHYKGRNVRVTLLSDISSRKLAEAEMVKAKLEAEHANQAKSEFLSRMSHELRTPLNSILGFAQLMEMSELTPAHKKSVYHILNSGRHLLNLINEVLDIAKIEAGHISFSPEPVHLDEFAADMNESVVPYAEEHGIHLTTTNLVNKQLYVFTDPIKLKQIWLNLVHNSIKYNRPGGNVVIRIEMVSNYMAGVDFARVSFTDTGMGIAPEDIDKLFIPFERIGADRTNVEGTGLGLAVIKKLMDAMGINFGVDSKAGEGSTFWIDLQVIDYVARVKG